MRKSKVVRVPFINLRDVVVYPGMEQSLFIGRAQTIAALKHAKNQNIQILVLSQKKCETNDPTHLHEMYKTGTLCSIVGSVHFKDGTMKAVLRGKKLFKVNRLVKTDEVNFAEGVSRSALPKASGHLEEKLKNELLRLLIQARPGIVLNPESPFLNRLKAAASLNKFTQTMEEVLNLDGPVRTKHLGKGGFNATQGPSPAERRRINKSVKLRQNILEQVSLPQKIALIGNYLKQEVKLWAKAM